MQKTPTLVTWLLKAPFKFALISFITSILAIITFSLIFSNITTSATSLYILLTIAFAASTYFTIRDLPKIKIDRPSFVAIHSAQTILGFLLFTTLTYILAYNQHSLMFRLMMFDANHPNVFMFIIILISLYILFLLGTAIINFYIKICRIQQFNIPTWKILFSFPFGFSMLWIPGYLLDTTPVKTPSQEIKSKTYSKIINWALTSNINTVSAFVFITILSGFFIGTAPILLTFILALIFGLWSTQIGKKKFEKQMNKAYTTTAIAINIIMIIILSCFYAFAPKPNVHINITESGIITTQGQ